MDKTLRQKYPCLTAALQSKYLLETVLKLGGQHFVGGQRWAAGGQPVGSIIILGLPTDFLVTTGKRSKNNRGAATSVSGQHLVHTQK